MPSIQFSPISRRLFPLYISAFFQGIPFWYAIEKLFMISIGFNTASIGLMIGIMSAVMLLIETPSGVLADRWSRKGVMALGCAALLLSGAIGAASFTPTVYIISCVFWGVYAALYSGTYDSVIYDTAMEEHGSSKQYTLYLGRLRAVEGAAFIIGALCGGLIASSLTMRDAYILSLPLIAISFAFLWRFREPQLHKAVVSEPVFIHIKQTFSAVLRHPTLLPIVIATVGFSVLLDIVFELNQLWFIAIATPVSLYGIISAAIFSSWTTGGLIAAQAKTTWRTTLLIALAIASAILLIITRQFWLMLASLVTLSICLIALGVILSKKLHDELPSQLRAGSTSVVSTLARIILVPGSILFTTAAHVYTIFAATYILLGVIVVASISFLLVSRTERSPADKN